MKAVKFRELAGEMARAGETQADISELLFISKPSLNRRMTGRIKWTEYEKKKLSKHYKRDIQELFKEEN